MSLPLVTCLCPTMESRHEWLPRVLKCFSEQTYPNRELLFVGPAEVPQTESIRVVASDAVLGEKRNAGVAAARGDVIIHFDDDDWSAPERITNQVFLMMGTGKSVVGYHSYTCQELRPVHLLTDEGLQPTTGWWKYRQQHGAAAGTSLCYRREWALAHPFPAVSAGEDDAFYDEAKQLNAVAVIGGANFICVTNHHGSTSGRLIGGVEWEQLPGRPGWFTC